jgi:hypothetical protein
MPKKKRQLNKSIRCKCSVCGAEFFATRPSDVCVDKSTCRVKKHQAALKVENLAKALMLDFDSFGVYNGFVDRFPTLKEQVNASIEAHGIPATMEAISLAWQTAGIIDEQWNAIAGEKQS